jgi:hypothetical protein
MSTTLRESIESLSDGVMEDLGVSEEDLKAGKLPDSDVQEASTAEVLERLGFNTDEVMDELPRIVQAAQVSITMGNHPSQALADAFVTGLEVGAHFTLLNQSD